LAADRSGTLIPRWPSIASASVSGRGKHGQVVDVSTVVLSAHPHAMRWPPPLPGVRERPSEYRADLGAHRPPEARHASAPHVGAVAPVGGGTVRGAGRAEG